MVIVIADEKLQHQSVHREVVFFTPAPTLLVRVFEVK